MPLSGPITYNGLTLDTSAVTHPAGGGPGSGFRNVRLDLSPISVAQYLDKAPLRDGLVAGDLYEGQRIVTLTCDVFGSSPGDLWTLVQSFLAAFNPVNNVFDPANASNLGFVPLTFRWPSSDTVTWPLGYIPMQVYARPDAPAVYVEQADAQGGLAGKGGVVRCTSRLICIDPRKYLTTAGQLLLNTINTSLLYRGDYPSWPTVTITMTGAGLSNFTIIFRDPAGVNRSVVILSLTGTVNADVVVVDYQARTVTLNGTNKPSLVVSATWSAVGSDAMGGASRAFFQNATHVAPCIMAWREAWS